MFRIQNSDIGMSTSLNTEKFDFVNDLPTEIGLYIFSFLSAKELGRCCLVSKQWQALASNTTLWNALDLRKISPLIKVFDESDWAAHVDLPSFKLATEDVSPLDKHKVIPALTKLLSSLPIEKNRGVTLLTIPKGLTMNKLVKIAESTLEIFWDHISNKVEDAPVDQTYRIVITNNILEGSRYRYLNSQKLLVSTYGLKIPNVIEITALLVGTFINSGKGLYKDAFTRCSEQVDGCQLVVGGFTSKTPKSSFYIDIKLNLPYAWSGIGGVLQGL